MKKYAIGIDLGGTFIKYMVADSDGNILFQGKLPSMAKVSAGAVVNQLVKAVGFCKEFGNGKNISVEGVGIGTPGIVTEDCRKVIGAAENIAGWEDIDLAGIIEQATGLRTVVNNDANLMALGETLYGAARGCTDVVFLTVGTGIGGGILIDSKIYGGYKNRGTEIGHITINYDGERCVCGNIGCLECYATTSALVKRFEELAGIEAGDVDGEMIVDFYRQGDPAAVKAMDEHWNYLAQGVVSVIHVFSPQKVVVGGGISEAGEFYTDGLRQNVLKYVIPSCASNTRITGAELGNKAGCLGAIGFALKQLS